MAQAWRGLALAIGIGLSWSAGPLPVRADPPAPWLYPGEKLVDATLPADGRLTLKGWTRDGRGAVYRLAVKKGETYEIAFAARSKFTGLVVFDMSLPVDAEGLFSSEDAVGGKGSLTADKDTTWLIRPYYSKMSPRRGLGAPYLVTLTRKG